MGGRGDTSKSFNENKIVSNIDAPRNKPFRDKRAKELEAERTAKPARKSTVDLRSEAIDVLRKNNLKGYADAVERNPTAAAMRIESIVGRMKDSIKTRWEHETKQERAALPALESYLKRLRGQD